MFEILSIFGEHTHKDWRRNEVRESLSRDYHILVFIETGSVIYEINNKSTLVSKGDILYISSNVSRKTYGDGEHPHQKYAILFRYTKGIIPVPLVDDMEYKLIHCRGLDYVKNRFSLLVQQWIGKLPYYQTNCIAMLLELLVLSAREAEQVQFPARKVSMVSFIQKYILSNYQQPIRIEQLAQQVDRTPNYVTKIFKEITGQRPIEYLNQVRITAAHEYLLNTHLSIGQIAERVGFNDQFYFNKVYKQIYGMPPSSTKHGKTTL